MLCYIWPSFRARRLHLNFKIAILHHVLAFKLHLVRKGCSWDFKIVILHQLLTFERDSKSQFDTSFWHSTLISRERVTSDLSKLGLSEVSKLQFFTSFSFGPHFVRNGDGTDQKICISPYRCVPDARNLCRGLLRHNPRTSQSRMSSSHVCASDTRDPRRGSRFVSHRLAAQVRVR
jgi:hypothetical protein